MVSSTFVRSAGLLSALFSLKVQAGASGVGKTTRYWDCCKPSCSWKGKADVTAPVGICDASDKPLANSEAPSGCSGGTAYMCSSQAPWAVNSTLAYGFAAVNIAGGSESSWCSACYALKFTSGTVAGKTLIVQATNTGGDLGSNQFDLAIPGGGVGIFNGCTQEFGAPSSGWGERYGGVDSASACSSFPSAMKPGCEWRYDWFEGANNPTVEFEQVSCPAEIVAKSGSRRNDDATMPKVVGPVGATAVAPAVAAPVVAPVVAPANKLPISPPAPTTPAAKAPTNNAPASAPVTPATSKPPCKADPAAKDSVAALYYQCGGQGWTGPKKCVVGATCKVQNYWYYQCVSATT